MTKKILTIGLILLLSLAVCACGKKESPSQSGTEKTAPEETVSQTVVETEAETMPEIANEKPVKLYYMDYEENAAKLIKSYQTEWSDDHDIAYFGAFNSDEQEIPFDLEKYAHLDRWEEVDTDVDYKIGYEISFDAGGEHRVITILSPQDIADSEDLFDGDVATEEVTGYLGVWMYDDIHQEDGAWYSHVTPEEYDDDTLLTSIKIRLTPRFDEVKNLKLKAFSYSSPLEFDADNHYNNRYSYEISIIEK